MAAGMHEIHKSTQNTRDQNKLLVFCGLSLKIYHYKKHKARLLFLWVALSVAQRRA